MHTTNRQRLVFQGLELMALRQLLGPYAAEAPTDHVAFSPDELELDAESLHQRMQNDTHPTLVDIREHDELPSGMLDEALHIPMNSVVHRLRAFAPDKEAEVVLYCRSGHRSLFMAAALQILGYTNVRSLRGGIKACRAYGLVRKAS